MEIYILHLSKHFNQEAIVGRLPQPYRDEIVGISTATGIELGKTSSKFHFHFQNKSRLLMHKLISSENNFLTSSCIKAKFKI